MSMVVLILLLIVLCLAMPIELYRIRLEFCEEVIWDEE